MTEQERYWRFKGTLEHPWWCRDPAAYRTPGGFGIHHFAESLEVGKFNLAWLMLPVGADPTSMSTYQQAPLGWVITVAPRVTLRGRPLTEHAALRNLAEFRALVATHQASFVKQACRSDMTWDRFAILLQRDTARKEL